MKKAQNKGAGIWDLIKNPIGTIKEAFNKVPTKLNNISTNTLKEYGAYPIRNLTVIRSPLKSHWTEALNTISMGKVKELQKKYGYDKLFHLSLLADVKDKVIIIEKNEVVHIAPIDKDAISKDTEYYNIGLNKSYTLDQLINNTLQYMGPNKFYDYDAMGGAGHVNNCQTFITSILKANNLFSNQVNEFINQDITGMKSDLNKSGYGYVPVVLKKITELGSHASRLIGKGKNQKEDIFDFVLNNKHRFL